MGRILAHQHSPPLKYYKIVHCWYLRLSSLCHFQIPSSPWSNTTCHSMCSDASCLLSLSIPLVIPDTLIGPPRPLLLHKVPFDLLLLSTIANMKGPPFLSTADVRASSTPKSPPTTIHYPHRAVLWVAAKRNAKSAISSTFLFFHAAFTTSCGVRRYCCDQVCMRCVNRRLHFHSGKRRQFYHPPLPPTAVVPCRNFHLASA